MNEQNKVEREAHPLHGLLAEFQTPEALLQAIRGARENGYERIETYTPWPVEGLNEALALPQSRIPPLAVIGGVLGCAGGYGLQCFASIWSYPWNIGGRPYYSWPQFIPVTFEMTILFSCLVIFFAVFLLNGLPRPYQPVFNAPVFARATSDRFFLCVEACDPKFDSEKTRQLLKTLGADDVYEVEQ